MPSKRTYLTTPIYYVNSVPHVGTATTTLLADATARYRRLRGEDAFFLTGTDEHAQKVAEAAAKAGKDPQTFVDEVSQAFVRTWEFLDCRYDDFIRTSEPRHQKVVQEIFRRLSASDDVYLGEYEGWYSVSDETFFRDTDVDDNGFVKETGAKVERIKEEVHYFRLSAYGERLKAHILAHPDFLQPDTRRNEVLAFIDAGLRDIAISRKSAGWGIPVPGDPGKVLYVWFDALINYLSETGWPDDPAWETLWPADAHLMAKEIFTRFHATLWPAMLLALGVPLPRHVVGHGWWVVRDESTNELGKGSKSKGNIPTPQEVVERMMTWGGTDPKVCRDALRYYLLRDIRFTDDSEFALSMLVGRTNADLGNDLGNILNRVLKAGYYDGVVPTPRALDPGIAAAAEQALAAYVAHLERFDWGQALQAVNALLSQVNRYLGETAPWKAAKAGDAAAVNDAVYNALEGLRLAAYLLSPAMPHVAGQIAAQLGLESLGGDGSWETQARFGALTPGTRTGEPQVLFPRLTIPVADAPASPPPAPKEKAPVSTPEPPEPSSTITIDDFLKVELRVADIVSAEKVEKADKLLKLGLRIGDEERTILSGIAQHYTPESLVGTQIVVVANLAPRTMRGIESKGMLLAATDADGRVILIRPEAPGAGGARVG